MPGGRISVTAFDSSSKLAWLNADFNGFMHTAMAIFGALLLLVIVVHDLMTNVSLQVLILATPVISAVVAFVLVFCLRWNKTVIGKQRDFRYCCRWL